MRHCRLSRRLLPRKNERMSIKSRKKMGTTVVCGLEWGSWGCSYNFRGDTHADKLFSVVGARFGAVICDEDDLLSYVNVSTVCYCMPDRVSAPSPLLRSISKVSTVPSNM